MNTETKYHWYHIVYRASSQRGLEFGTFQARCMNIAEGPHFVISYKFWIESVKQAMKSNGATCNGEPLITSFVYLGYFDKMIEEGE